MLNRDLYHKLTVELRFADQDELQAFRQAGADYNDHYGERSSDQRAFVHMVIDYEKQRKEYAQLRKDYAMLLQSHGDLSQRYGRVVAQLQAMSQHATAQSRRA